MARRSCPNNSLPGPYAQHTSTINNLKHALILRSSIRQNQLKSPAFGTPRPRTDFVGKALILIIKNASPPLIHKRRCILELNTFSYMFLSAHVPTSHTYCYRFKPRFSMDLLRNLPQSISLYSMNNKSKCFANHFSRFGGKLKALLI